MKKRMTALLLCLILLLTMTIPCFAAPPEVRTVRVGFASLQGFLYQNEDGSYGGLAYDLLREIGSINNWQYEFYECGYAEAEELFQKEEIDLFIPYQKTAEREALYEYSEEVFCTNRASLITLPESPIDYEDLRDMKNRTIGVLDGTRNGERFREYFAEQGVSVKLKTGYTHQGELIEAARRGEVDAFISASNREITDFKIISMLPQTDSYVIAPKGNRTYLQEVDRAIRIINAEMPALLPSLEEKYQKMAGGSYPSLSEEEKEYIAEKGQVTVLISREECDQNGDFSGGARVIFQEIGKLTGLTFVPVVSDGTSALMEELSSGKADMIYAFNRDFDWAEQHQVWLTGSYADFYMKLITRSGQPEIKKVAVVPGTYIAYYIENATDYAVVECESYAACINAVLDKRADVTYCNSPIGNYYSTFPKYRRLSFLTAYDFETAYSMAVSKSSEQILVDVLNKSLQCLSSTELSRIFETQLNSRQVTLVDFFYSNPIVSVGVIVLFLVISLTMAFMIFYSRRIKKKNQQLAIANNAKTDFMSRMSHDMRTPMNGILGLTQLTREETEPEVIRANLEQIELSGRVLLDLINDTLDMNKIESGKLELHLKPINSEVVFGNVMTNAGIMAAEKGVKLDFHGPAIGHGQWVPVLADASRLEQILFNVISNAIKFTPKGGTVELLMETVSIGEGLVKDRYTIRDTGIGMSAEFLPHLFDAFSQEARDNANRDKGTGLGMSIVKQLVELMNGTIEVKSELNKGTVVTLFMQYPICAAPAETEQKAEVVYEKFRGKQILVCEDHPINAQIIVKVLKKYGMLVEVAENGAVGLQCFCQSEEGFYDCILMDIRMPVMDGLETTRRIRSQKRSDAKTIPIIAMTANAFEEDVQNCLEAGMNSHLTKPIEFSKLYECLAKYMQQNRDMMGEKDG